MSMFSICTTFVTEGKLDETLGAMAAAEADFTAEIGVLSRLFLQCVDQPHVIWAVTQWQSEKHHHDAAQSIMKARRDDRIASIRFGTEPYFEIFCDDAEDLRSGEYAGDRRCVVVAHGLIGARSRDRYRALRRERLAHVAGKLDWLRIHHNRYHPDEFVALLGFRSDAAFAAVRDIEGMCLEEYLFTGLRRPLGMSWLASYNQFSCVPLAFDRPRLPHAA